MTTLSAVNIISQVSSVGPANADIMIVGEAPGRSEVTEGKPFVGISGQELTRILHDAGIMRTDCYLTNVCRVRPPGNDINKFFIKHTPKSIIPGPEILQGIELLFAEIESVKPNIIIALGNTALWALTGKRGIVKWRGSLLKFSTKEFPGHHCKVLPTYHPAAIMRQWSWRYIAVHDCKRALRESKTPAYTETVTDFLIRPDYRRTMDIIQWLTFESVRKQTDDTHTTLSQITGRVIPNMKTVPTPPHNPPQPIKYRLQRPLNATCLLLAVDLETRNRHIACLGIAWNKREAICIPFMCLDREEGYWSEEEEITIILALKVLLTQENVGCVGQNFLYDCQYIARWWGFIPNVADDTMIKHHVCFSGMPKGLDFISSLYCENYVYWKDEGKFFDLEHNSEEDLWIYNCKDCINTYEVNEVLTDTIKSLSMEEPYKFQMRQFIPVLMIMIRGVRIDKKLKEELALELWTAISTREEWMNLVVGHQFNVRSPKQMAALFYHDLQIPVIKNRKTGRPTCDSEALEKMGVREPILKPIVDCINEIRSLGVFLATFVLSPLDKDGRMRCSFAIAGPETFRYSSSADAFGFGTNLQNIPAGTED